MYQYDNLDINIQQNRVDQYKDQMQRHLAGELSEAQFLPLRLQNGLYVQRLAPMYRIAVPYGMISSTQLRTIARISRDYDKGYVHFTTRQNIQLNWTELPQAPQILQELQAVEMHANQTSGNCIRNTTTDQFAGVAADEIEDPRPYCELIRQWSTFHPEFAFLPRKFKIAVCGSKLDRAAVYFHDIGIEIVRNQQQQLGFKIIVGGGLGRTPVIGSVINDFIELTALLPYLESILRVYNLHGRRDNKYKARIKILVRALGIDEFRRRVEQDYEKNNQRINDIDKELDRIKTFFKAPSYQSNIDLAKLEQAFDEQLQQHPDFARWINNNTHPHKQAGYKSVTLSFKKTGVPPGDASDTQLDAAADMAERFSFGELRISHHQNMVLADVAINDLFEVWQQAQQHGFADPNIGTLNDMICCPGGDYCALANAKSIPIAESIQRMFSDYQQLDQIGHLELNISGCMNACGHHHIGHIGILGVDKKGQEFYQISLGGNQEKSKPSLAKILGPSFSAAQVPQVIKKLIDVYLQQRLDNSERFKQTYERIGISAFKEAIYSD